MLDPMAGPVRRWNPHRDGETRMADHESRTRRAPGIFGHCSDCNDKRRGQVAGERHILELISLGAPLPVILNKLCAAIDVRIGNVVSLVLLPDLCSPGQSAMHMGLSVFSSTSILSHDETLLGTLEIYSCDPRGPAPHEDRLIERMIHLAAIALQRHGDGPNFERPSRRAKSGIGDSFERSPFVN
jgi:hypothetical protein